MYILFLDENNFEILFGLMVIFKSWELFHFFWDFINLNLNKHVILHLFP